MRTHSLKIGLIGAGRIGHMHAEHLTSRVRSAELLMVADAFEETARECAERYSIPYFVQDYHAILDHPDIQAVVICSSTDTHAQIIEEAAQAGKHIFCEKPIALDLPSIDRALDSVERSGVKLQIGFNRRFDANYRRVRDRKSTRLNSRHITISYPVFCLKKKKLLALRMALAPRRRPLAAPGVAAVEVRLPPAGLRTRARRRIPRRALASGVCNEVGTAPV